MAGLDTRTREQLLAQLEAAQRRIAALEERAPHPRDAHTGAEQLRVLLNEVPDYVYFKDRGRRYVTASRSLCLLLHRELADIIGQRDEDLLPPDIAQETAADEARILETGVALVDKEEGGPCDPRGVWMSTTKLPWRNAAGEIIGLFGISRDITERKHHEARLRENGERFQAFYDATFEGIGMSEGGRIVDVNDRLAEMLGYARDELMGKDVASVFVAPNDREMVASCMRDKFEDGYEYQALHHDGSLVDLEVRGRVIHVGGRTLRISAIRDVTERKRAAAEQERLRAQLLQAQKMEALGQLAGGVAHDINNMLTAVTGTISLMQEDLIAQEAPMADLDAVLDACARGHELTRNLLAFARGGKYVTRRVALEEVVRNTEQLLRRTVEKGIDVRIQAAPDLYDVEADPGQISHVLLNLCLNGCDAMGRSGVLSIRAENAQLHNAPAPDLASGPYVRLTVTDTGYGMDGDTQQRAFEPFFTTKPPTQSSGLGLSMVYGTIKNHGGSVSIESAPGVGTTVSILLPALTDSSAELPADSEPSLAVMPRTVLVVDDEPALRRIASRILMCLGCESLVAENGLHALELYRRHAAAIDLVLLDLSMPVMDGVETFHQLRALNPAIRILICSGHYQDARVTQLLRDGALGFVQKPYTKRSLAADIGTVMGVDIPAN